MFNTYRKQLTQELNPLNLFPICPVIKAEPQQTHCCEKLLRVRKTTQKTIVTLNVGEIQIHETVKQCKVCKKIYDSEEPHKLAPEYCKFGYDVIAQIGQAYFQEHLTESDIAKALWQQNVFISEREVSYLAKKFICYLALAHNEIIPQIRELLAANGGFFLHYDATNDGSSPHLIVAVDELENIVLGSIKASSESAESVGSLLEQVKRNYGDPLATVHDLSRANLAAAKSVFPGVADYVCHFHFLRDLGKDLFEYEHSRIRSILQDFGIQGHLKGLAKKLRPYVQVNRLGKDMNTLSENDITYFLTEWILDCKDELSAYGFPFDREKLVFVQRMLKVKQLMPASPQPGGYLETLQKELDAVLEDKALIKFVSALEKKVRHFDRLRDALRVAPPEGTDGLNDNGLDCDMEEIKNSVEKFIDSDEIKEAALVDADYGKMIGQIRKYWAKLFTMPITVTAKNGCKKVIYPQRTNNLMEQLFREMTRGCRKRTGDKSLGKILTNMLAETPLIKNLENKKYLEIFLNGCANLGERFAEIEAQHVREKMKKAEEEREKLHPAVKKLIRLPKFLNCLVSKRKANQGEKSSKAIIESEALSTHPSTLAQCCELAIALAA